MKTVLHIMLAFALITPVLTSCSDDAAPAPTVDNNPTDTTDQTPSNSELIMRLWLVDQAFVDGTTPDLSSKGLKVEFKANNAYRLFRKDGGTFDGTWTFLENETKVDLGNGTQFHQTWTIQELSETKLDVTFVSPFTGQNAQWIMK